MIARMFTLLIGLLVITNVVKLPTADVLRSVEAPVSSTSLCGEEVTKETGVLSGLYYAYFESELTYSSSNESIPIVVWLSGGPGCSGLIAAVFENGPCTFDDEKQTLELNPYSWTKVAHVLYVDQPIGTGFSRRNTAIKDGGGLWTERQAMQNLRQFLEAFIDQHPSLKTNELFIFGESFGGHYAPDLVENLLQSDRARWQKSIKGLGIVSGVVSLYSITKSWPEYYLQNHYAQMLSGEISPRYSALRHSALTLMEQCFIECPRHMRYDDSLCLKAAATSEAAASLTSEWIRENGRNVYDIRRPCHLDRLGLCYRFSRVEKFINQPHVLEFFGRPSDRWHLCDDGVYSGMNLRDQIRRSEVGVSMALDHGIRVLAVCGEADGMVPCTAQEWWTTHLEWSNQQHFRAAHTHDWTLNGQVYGRVKSAKGLTSVFMDQAGHMVPHDQPEAMFALLKSFLSPGKRAASDL